MDIHKNKELFCNLIKQASDYYETSEDCMIREYFMANYLSRFFNETSKEFVVKGSVALKMCYNALRREIHDIDFFSRHGDVPVDEFRNCAINSDTSILWLNTSDERYIKGKCINNSGKTETSFFVDYVMVDSCEHLRKEAFMCGLQRFLSETNQTQYLFEYNAGEFFCNVVDLEDVFVGKIFAASNKYVSKNKKEVIALKHLLDMMEIYDNYQFNDGDIIQRIEKKKKTNVEVYFEERAERIFQFEIFRNMNLDRFKDLIDNDSLLKVENFCKLLAKRFL